MNALRTYEEQAKLARMTPEFFNFAAESIDRHAFGGADGHRTALVADVGRGIVARYTFLDLAAYSNRLAHVLVKRGVGPGDIVLSAMAPSGAAAVVLLAALKVGAAAMPLSPGVSADFLSEKITRLGAAAIIGDQHSADMIGAAAHIFPEIGFAAVAHASVEGTEELWTSLIGASEEFEPHLTKSGDPALILQYPDMPAGALYSHGALRARAMAADYVYQSFPAPSDVLWSATDWASDNGWIDAVLPAWFGGAAVAATPASPEDFSGFLKRWGVRVAHIPVNGLPLLETVAGGEKTPLRVLAVFGETPRDKRAALAARFGAAFIPVVAHPAFGPILAPFPASGPSRSEGSWGRPPPGCAIDVIDSRGRVLTAGENGEIAILATDGGLPFRPSECRSAERIGRWLCLGRQGRRDLDGLFWPVLPPAPSDFSTQQTAICKPPPSGPPRAGRRARRTDRSF